MPRTRNLRAAALVLALAMPAMAEDMVTGITGQLRDLGFDRIEVGRTLLGRTRIVASSADGEREIILNPRTGEILRDLWRAAPDQPATGTLVDTRGAKGGDDTDGGRDERSGSDNTVTDDKAADRPDPGSGAPDRDKPDDADDVDADNGQDDPDDDPAKDDAGDTADD